MGTTVEAVNISIISSAKQARKEMSNFKLKGGEAWSIHLRPVDVVQLLQVSSTSKQPVDPKIAAILDEFRDIYRSELPPVMVDRDIKTDIPEAFLSIPTVEGAETHMHRPFPMSEGEKEVLQQLLIDMLQKGFIEETADWNGWSSPVFLLRKPGPPRVNVLQQFRLIVDYRDR